MLRALLLRRPCGAQVRARHVVRIGAVTQAAPATLMSDDALGVVEPMVRLVTSLHNRFIVIVQSIGSTDNVRKRANQLFRLDWFMQTRCLLQRGNIELTIAIADNNYKRYLSRDQGLRKINRQLTIQIESRPKRFPQIDAERRIAIPRSTPRAESWAVA
jgi:hypothetical protein